MDISGKKRMELNIIGMGKHSMHRSGSPVLNSEGKVWPDGGSAGKRAVGGFRHEKWGFEVSKMGFFGR